MRDFVRASNFVGRELLSESHPFAVSQALVQPGRTDTQELRRLVAIVARLAPGLDDLLVGERVELARTAFRLGRNRARVPGSRFRERDRSIVAECRT